MSTERWPPKRPLTFKPRGAPRLTSIREFDVDGGNTIVAIFQGSRGGRPELDIIVKYLQRGKRLRTPQHIHWAIDLVIKKQHDETLTNAFVEYLIGLYDQVEAFRSQGDRLERPLLTHRDRNTLRTFERLESYGEYSVEFTCHVLELIAIQEKTGNPNAFMFRGVLLAILEGQEITRIVSSATFRG